MTLFKRFLYAGTSFLAMTVHAHADPFSIGASVLSAFLSTTGIALAVEATYIGYAVLAAAAIGGQALLSAFAKPKGLPPQEYKNTFETGDSSEIRAVGRVRVGGLKAFGNTKKKDRYRLICHTKGRVSAVEEHFLGGRPVVLEADGAVSSPPYAKRGGSWVYIKSKVGDGTETAWPELISTFPDLWTSAHRVRGIAQSLVHYISPGLSDEKFLQLYQSGEPNYERIQRCEPVYDPRDGAQNVDNETTWVWSDNSILCAAHILRSYPSFASADIDWNGIGAEATKADAIVATKTGTEDRSRCWGFWGSESDRGDVMGDVLRSIGAEIVPGSDGKTLVRMVDDSPIPEMTIPSKHIYEIRRKYGPESVERPNICRVSYYSPERNYELTDIDMSGIAWARIQDEIDRVGEQYFDVQLPFCPSASQAQRLARRLFALARADAGSVVTNFAGKAAWGVSIADIEFADLDNGSSITETCALGAPRVNDDEGTVEIPYTVWPNLPAWNPAVDEAAAPESIPDLAYVSDVPTPAAPSSAIAVATGNGAATGWETRVVFAAALTDPEANYRTYTAGEPDSWSSMTDAPSFAYAAGDLRGQKIDARVRDFVGSDGSQFSAPLEVASLSVDNTACGEPTVIASSRDSTTSTRTLTVSVPEMRASYVAQVEYLGSDPIPSNQTDIRPGEQVVYTVADYGTYRIATYTSDNTKGAEWTQTFSPPPP